MKKIKIGKLKIKKRDNETKEKKSSKKNIKAVILAILLG